MGPTSTPSARGPHLDPRSSTLRAPGPETMNQSPPSTSVLTPTMESFEHLSARVDAIETEQSRTNDLKRRYDALEATAAPPEIEKLCLLMVELQNKVQILQTAEQDRAVAAEPKQISLLPLLQKMDFRNPDDLLALERTQKVDNSLLLFNPGEEHRNEAIAYTVRGGSPFAGYLIASSRQNPNEESSFWNTPEWAGLPIILELDAHRKETAVPPMFPKYIWEIGEI